MPEKQLPKAIHNSKGEVTIHGVRKAGHLWCFVCETENGRPLSLRADQQFWKSDISDLLKRYESQMPTNDCRISPKLLTGKVTPNEYQSAQSWYRQHSKSLPKIWTYDRFSELVRRALKNARNSSLGYGSAIDDFDQDVIAELLAADAPTFDSDREVKATDEDGQSNRQWDDARAAERFAAANPDAADDLANRALPEEQESPIDYNQTLDFIAYQTSGSDSHNLGFDRAMASAIANHRKEKQVTDPDAEKITLVRSQMGDYLEQYFFFRTEKNAGI